MQKYFKSLQLRQMSETFFATIFEAVVLRQQVKTFFYARIC